MKLEARFAKECKLKGFSTIVTKTNELVDRLKADLQGLNIPPFDRTLSQEGVSLGAVETSLVAHRLIKKFSPPGQRQFTSSEAIRGYLDYERQLAQREPVDMWSEGELSLKLRKSNLLVQRTVRRVGPFKGFFCDTILWSGGETFIAQKGETSVSAKLLVRENWTCTTDVVDLVCAMVYSAPGLKAMARKHIGEVSRSEKAELYRLYANTGDIGLLVFSHLLRERVLIIVAGARSATVPKNVDTDRFINIEPMFNMLLQRAFGAWIRKILKLLGNNIDPETVKGRWFDVTREAQRLHGLMISHKNKWTVDFKNASDSTLIDSVYKILGPTIGDYACLLRSQRVLIGNHFFEPIKLSSMGNGFTFEIMTLLIYVVSRQYDLSCRVFGDDLILEGGSEATKCLEALRRIGYKINDAKTFTEGPIRESCGYFVFHSDDTVHYLTSFDFAWCESLSDVLITHNKLKCILIECNNLDQLVFNLLMKCMTDIYEYIPKLCRGYTPIQPKGRRQNLSAFAYSDQNLSRSQSKSKTLKKLFNELNKTEQVACLCLEPELKGSVLVSYQYWLPTRTKHRTVLCNYWTALALGTRDGQFVRGQGKWITLPALVTKYGNMYYLRNVLRGQNSDYSRMHTDKTI